MLIVLRIKSCDFLSALVCFLLQPLLFSFCHCFIFTAKQKRKKQFIFFTHSDVIFFAFLFQKSDEKWRTRDEKKGGGFYTSLWYIYIYISFICKYISFLFLVYGSMGDLFFCFWFHNVLSSVLLFLFYVVIFRSFFFKRNKSAKKKKYLKS